MRGKGGIDNETDVSGQITLMNEAMKKGADGLLLAPANSTALVNSCQKVRNCKIPIVLTYSSINSTEFDACYMTDNMDAGKMAAKEMLDMLKEQGNSSMEPLEVGISYNDTYGHNNGDLCLKHFAAAMYQCFPKESILGRYGGDEFVVYLKNVTKETAYDYMKEFQKRISHLVLSTGEEVQLSASAGGEGSSVYSN